MRSSYTLHRENTLYQSYSINRHPTRSRMNQIEYESVVLNTAWGMIDGMVNYEIFDKQDLCGTPLLVFESDTHARLFVILLTDFLSPVRLSTSTFTTESCDRVPILKHLESVCRSPQLGADVSDFHKTVMEFSSWLTTNITSNGVNLSAIDICANIHIKRDRYIKMCGNIAKHNALHLNGVINYLCKLLKKTGHCVEAQEANLALEQFFSWFFNDMFVFHSNHIAQFLNDIRWYLFRYLQSEYEKSRYLTCRFEKDYAFRVPESISDPLATWMYWALMNRVRTTPFMTHFVVADEFKHPHHTESPT